MTPGMQRVHQLMASVRMGPYTSVGSYQLFWLMSDGGTLGYQTVRDNLWQIARSTRDGEKDGWRFEACDINWENEDMFDDHTGEPIECAYPTDPPAQGAPTFEQWADALLSGEKP